MVNDAIDDTCDASSASALQASVVHIQAAVLQSVDYGLFRRDGDGATRLAQLEGEIGSFKCDEEMELTTGPIRINKDSLPITSYKFKKS